MPTFTQTFQSDYGWEVQGNGYGVLTGVGIRIRRGNNDTTHVLHVGNRFILRGPANNNGTQINFTPDQITKVEVRFGPYTVWHMNGAAYAPPETLFLVPISTDSTHAHSLWQTYYGSAANAALMSTHETNYSLDNTQYSPWYEIDDGTDLRSAFASNPNWDTGTTDSPSDGAVYAEVLKIASWGTYPGGVGGGTFWDMYSHTGARPMEMRITYESQPDLILTNSISYSGQNSNAVVNLSGLPEQFGRWHGDKPEILTKAGLFPLQTAGSGDLPVTRLNGTANPNGYDWAVWGNVGGPGPNEVRARLFESFTYPPPTSGTMGRPAGNYNIHMENYNAATGYFCYDTSTWRTKDGPLSTASGRFSIRHDSLPASGDQNPIAVRAFRNGVQVWEFSYRTYFYELLGNIYHSHKVHIENNVDNIITPWSNTRYLLDWHTWEFQVTNDLPNGNIKVRLYAENNPGGATPPNEEWSVDCTDVTFDELQWGLPHTSLASATADNYVNDIDLWDDYYLGGFWKDESNYGVRYEFKPWEEFEFDGTDWNPIDFVGQVTSTSPLTLDTNYDLDPLRDFEGQRWPYDSDDNLGNHIWTKYPYQSYGWGGSRHGMDIYVPNTPTPPGGRRVFLYLHGGFFVSGTEAAIPQGLIAELILQEYVVCSLQVMLSSTEPVINRVSGTGSQAYPGYDYNGNANTARHPTQILDYKMAVAWLQETAQKQTYGLSGEVIAGGHSAGGYPALMAMLTKDVTNDGSNLSYRLQDSPWGHPSVPDPDILGCYVWSPPVDFESIRDFDPTARLNLQYGNTGQYTMETTIQLYWGINFGQQPTQAQLDGSSPAYHIANSPLANVKPVAYSGGATDYLVPAVDMQGFEVGQATKLEDAYAARGIPERFSKVLQAETQHYQTPYRFDVIHLLEFLNSL